MGCHGMSRDVMGCHGRGGCLVHWSMMPTSKCKLFEEQFQILVILIVEKQQNAQGNLTEARDVEMIRYAY